MPMTQHTGRTEGGTPAGLLLCQAFHRFYGWVCYVHASTAAAQPAITFGMCSAYLHDSTAAAQLGCEGSGLTRCFLLGVVPSSAASRFSPAAAACW